MLSFKPRTALVALGLACSAHTAEAGEATDLASLSGTWSFTGSHSGGTSPSCTGTVAFQWILAIQPDGSAMVTVQGETVYPKLQGMFTGNAAGFSGVLDALHPDPGFPAMSDRAHIELTGSGTTFSATETASFFDKATDGSAYSTTCTYDIKGRRL